MSEWIEDKKRQGNNINVQMPNIALYNYCLKVKIENERNKITFRYIFNLFWVTMYTGIC